MNVKRISLKLKINLVLGVLLLAILICWGSFYTRANNAVTQNAEDLATQFSGRVSDLVYTTFLYLEHTAMVLSTSEEVAALLQEENSLHYYTLREDAVALADSVYQSNGLVDDILVYDTEGDFCRLRGDLGNTAATRLGYLLPSQALMQHSTVVLEGSTYLTYSIEVTQGNQSLGYVVFLMELTRLQEIFQSYDSSGLLSVALVADGNLISETTEFSTVAEVERKANTYSLTAIGTSPFSVLVWDDGSLNEQLLRYFIVAGLFITVLLLLLMVCGYRLMNWLVFTPVLKLMDDAKELENNPERHFLEITGQIEFDQLVAQFNQLILQLEDRTQAAFALERAMQTTELEKQTAIITSLKKQINAHFTVNTLAVIRRLNQLGETEKVAKLSEGLAYLLRYAHDGDTAISCLDEMYVLEKYIGMMQIRYPDRFTADLDIDSDLEDVLIPRMLLQPIIENAIIHGFANKSDGVLTLRGTITAEKITFTICDNGHGIVAEPLALLREQIAAITPTSQTENGLDRIALVNIQKRIVTDFGIGYGLSIASTIDHGSTVTLHLPLHDR